jgi:pre-mRNA-processing factor 19
MLICSLTNSPTPHPVLSLKSHRIFDNEALTTYISTHGTDPITNDAMTTDEIIPITTTSTSTESTTSSAVVTNPEYSSIPTMLASFQSAWDSLSLELFHLRKELSDTKKQLSLALYRQDAAVNVAVKACEERDEAKQALAKLIAEPGNSSSVAVAAITDKETKTESTRTVEPTAKDVEMTEDDNGNTDTGAHWSQIASEIQQQQKELLVKHKGENKELNKVTPFDLNSVSNLKAKPESFITISKVLDPIYSADVNQSLGEALVALNSGVFQLLDIKVSPPKVISKVSSTSKSTIPVSFWLQDQPYALIVMAPRKNAKIPVDKYSIVNVRTKKSIQITPDLTGITLAAAHPTLPLYILARDAEFEVFYNHESVFTQQLSSPLDSIKFHTDGLFLGLSYKGDSSLGLDIYDLSERAFKLNIQYAVEGKGETLVDFVFGRNGYYLFLSTNDKLRLFDMRKNAIVLESDLANQSSSKLVIDMYTSLIVAGDNYVVFDRKKKSFSDVHEFELSPEYIAGFYAHDGGVRTFVVEQDGSVQVGVSDIKV